MSSKRFPKAIAAAICSAALVIPAGAAFAELSSSQHPHQIYSGFSYDFKIRNSTQLKCVWPTPETIYTEPDWKTWANSPDYIYDYWYVTVNEDQEMIFGSATNPNEGKDVEIDEKTAMSYFNLHVHNVNWSRIEPSWSDGSKLTMSVKDPVREEVNGWNMYKFTGTIEDAYASAPVCAYMVCDGDTASWAFVIGNSKSITSKNVEEEALKVARGYRNGEAYILSGGTPFDYSYASQANTLSLGGDEGSSQTITVDEDGNYVVNVE